MYTYIHALAAAEISIKLNRGTCLELYSDHKVKPHAHTFQPCPIYPNNLLALRKRGADLLACSIAEQYPHSCDRARRFCIPESTGTRNDENKKSENLIICQELGRFSLRRRDQIIAVGIVKSILE